CMNSVRIVWRGLNGYTEKDMAGVIASVSQKNWINFSANDTRSLVSSVAGVEEVQVVKRFPDRVFITVKERVPVAMMFAVQGGRTVLVQVDKNGVLLPPSSATAHLSLPLISGIPIEHIPEGMRLPARFHALIGQISDIRSLSQNYFAGISEIHVVPKEYGNYELVLYPLHSRTRVLVDRQLNEDALQYMMVMLDVVNTLEKDVSAIDLRYGSVVYYPRQNSDEGVRLD
ncbi:MAG: cell division protein FtsQ/DivIB, partial [Treponemataceae bacterium]|nr:cell division protein FtsQ/DivIB [Treponemataceae bacterium]